MKSAEIRQAFLEYFAGQDHQIVSSSSLVPGNDPTLLFTNAGMVQFKDVFLGQDKRSYTRATSSQRCVRAGGKHNDLENVGYTARHHTFFEMLGNFSFGDYFKQEAIQFAWTFLTEDMGLEKEKLWITVFHEDSEAEEIWLKEVGVDPERFSRLGEKDNFWSMGDTGPCGPCTEIFYDHGEDIPGGSPGSPDEDGDRYIEIWNLVFMQFNRSADGSMVPLPKPSVDTGMGLERIAAIKQGVHSNYEIDLFQYLLKAAAKITNTVNHNHTSLKVIADHIRSCAFLISDDVLPSNEGRGYVLRRIIRRAIRHGHQLGTKDSFFHKLVKPLAEVMGEAYPELVTGQAKITAALKAEEEQFARTLDNGMAILEEAIAGLSDNIILGETVFKLYDTYGFPVDLTADIARERELSIDMAGFESAMVEQKNKARSASRFETSEVLKIELEQDTDFVGYEKLEHEASTVLALYKEGASFSSVTAEEAKNEIIVVVLDKTPFYAESGGQVGDKGQLSNSKTQFSVKDTQKQGNVFLHYGSLLKGSLSAGDKITGKVEPKTRQATVLNHSATHLMHEALRQVLGEHVSQKGSLVNTDYLRFDFSHNQSIDQAEIKQVEHLVNEQILLNSEVKYRVMPIEEAKKLGAMALFGEKYGDEVRVVSMGDFSIELCGGTHVNRTGDIGLFKIVQESGIAAGVRRIEAYTGKTALALIIDTEDKVKTIASLVKSGTDTVVDKIEQLMTSQRSLEKKLTQLKAKLASSAGDDLSTQAISINGIQVLAAVVDGFDSKALRETTDQLKNKLGSAIVILGTANEGKVSLVAGVSKDMTDRIKAGDLVNMVAQQVGGKGGGRPDMAMAGGSNPNNLQVAMTSVKPYLESIL